MDSKGRISIPIGLRAKLKLVEGSKVKLAANTNGISVYPFFINSESKFSRKTIGILGGMGPGASADLYLKLIKTCQQKYRARLDEDYPPIVIYNLPAPQMIDSLKNRRKLLRLLIYGVRKLENAGADFIMLACNTIHYFLPELRQAVSIPIVSIMEEVGKLLAKNRVEKVGLLATTTTVKQKVYESELNGFGISTLVPDKRSQNKLTGIIGKIVAGELNEKDRIYLKSLIEALKSKDAELVILGCTDLPLLITQRDSDMPLVDTLQVLADVAVSKSVVR